MTIARPYPSTPKQAHAAGVSFYLPRKACACGRRTLRTLDGKCVRCSREQEAPPKSASLGNKTSQQGCNE